MEGNGSQREAAGAKRDEKREAKREPQLESMRANAKQQIRKILLEPTESKTEAKMMFLRTMHNTINMLLKRVGNT